MKSWRTSSIRSRVALLAGLALLSGLLSLCLGPVALTPGEVLRALGGQGRGAVQAIVLHVRLPRTLGCLTAGMCLAVSGAVIQGVLANPLAAPNVIGVNAGAGLAVALSCAIAPAMAALAPVMAFGGAMAGVLVVLAIAQRTGASRMTLVLAGVAVSSMFSAGIDAVVTFVPDALNGYSDFRIGGFANLTMAQLRPALWAAGLGLAAALSLSNELDLLRLGTDTAQSLGLPARRFRLLLLGTAAVLAGAAVSFSGLLGFVGLIVPHMARRLVGEESLPLLTASAFGGAALVTLCDLLSRLLFAPFELPVGVVLSLAGGPFFLWLLLRQRRGRTI